MTAKNKKPAPFLILPREYMLPSDVVYDPVSDHRAGILCADIIDPAHAAKLVDPGSAVYKIACGTAAERDELLPPTCAYFPDKHDVVDGHVVLSAQTAFKLLMLYSMVSMNHAESIAEHRRRALAAFDATVTGTLTELTRARERLATAFNSPQLFQDLKLAHDQPRVQLRCGHLFEEAKALLWTCSRVHPLDPQSAHTDGVVTHMFNVTRLLVRARMSGTGEWEAGDFNGGRDNRFLNSVQRDTLEAVLDYAWSWFVDGVTEMAWHIKNGKG